MVAYDIVFSATITGSAGGITPGDALVLNPSAGQYVIASSANRTSYGRAAGIALTSGDATNSSVQIQFSGLIPASITGLGAGTQSWVRVASTGLLERCTPSGSDDVVGYCETDGSLHATFGQWTAGIINASFTAAGDLTGDNTSQTVAKVHGATAPAAGALTTGNVLQVSGASALSYGAVNLAGGANYVTGALPAANGGMGADVSAQTGIVKMTAGTASFLATIAATAGGMGADVSGSTGILKMTTGTASFLTAPSGTIVGTSDSQTLTNKVFDASSNTLSNVINANVGSAAAIAYSKLGGGGTETINSQQFDTNVNLKGTSRTVEPKNVQTTDATVTTLDSFTLASDTAVIWTAVVIGVKSDKSQAAAYVRTACFRNNGGTVAQVSTTQDGGTFEDDAAWDCTIDNSTTTIRVRVTGKAATTVQWSLVSQRLEVIS